MSSKKVAVALASLLAAPLALELGYRAWQRAGGYRYSAAAARAEIELVLSPMRDARPGRGARDEEAQVLVHGLHPYFGVEAKPRAARSLRSEGLQAGAGNERTILVLGGSVAAIFATGRGAQELCARSSADPRLAGRAARCISQGRGGFKQPQQLMLLGYLFARGIRPDLVLEIDGFNELALGRDNAARALHPLYPAFVPWARLSSSGSASPELLDAQLATWGAWRRAERWAASGAQSSLVHSALFGRWTLWRLRRMRASWAEAQRVYTDLLGSGAGGEPWRGPPFEAGLDAALAQVVRSWKEASLAMRAQCAERGIAYVHVLQPTLHDEGSKPVTEEELRAGSMLETWTEGVRAGYPLLRRAGEELREQGVDFLDLSQAFAEVAESLYVDAVHFGDRGNEILVERMSETVVAALERARPRPAEDER